MSFGYCVFTFEGGDWTHDDFAGLDRGFAAAKRLGFSYVEVPSLVLPDRPRSDAQVLDRWARVLSLSEKHALPISAIFASVSLLDSATRESELNGLVALARIVSTSGIAHLPVTVGIRHETASLAPARELSAIVSDVASDIHRFGVQLEVHPHIEGPLEHPAQINAFFDAAADSVGMCLDVGHVLAGGGDPIAVLGTHRDRVHYVHLKDVDQVAYARASGPQKYAAFRDPGAGSFDFQRFVNELSSNGFDGPILAENDLSPDPIASIEESYRYLTRLGL